MAEGKIKKVNTMDKYGRKMLSNVIDKINLESFNLKDNPIYQQGMQFLNDMMNPDSEQMRTMEQPYRRQFAEETAPGIANQFAMNDAISSSGFEHSMGRAAGDLEGNIAGMKQNAMMNASNQMLGYSQAPAQMQQGLVQMGLNGPQDFGYQVIPGSKGWGAGVGSAGGQMMAAYGANKMSNYANQPPQSSQQVTSWNQFNGQQPPSQQEMAGW
jgi:hypothetical protein